MKSLLLIKGLFLVKSQRLPVKEIWQKKAMKREKNMHLNLFSCFL